MHLRSLICFLASTMAITLTQGCSCDGPVDEDPPVEGEADAGEPDAGQPDAGEPVRFPAQLDLQFRGEGHGETWALAAVDLDGDGDEELVHSGRDLAAFTVEGLERGQSLWTLDWSGEGYATQFSDNEWAFDVKAVGDIDADGAPDLVAGTSFLELYAVSGKTGAVLWRRPLMLSGGFATRLTLFDGDGDDVKDVFVNGGASAYSGRTGDVLWTAALPKIVVFAHAAELDGTPGDELMVGIENNGLIGVPSGPKPILYAIEQDGGIQHSFQAAYSQASALAPVDFDADGLHEAIVTEGDLVHVVNADGGERFGFTLPGFPARPPQVAGAMVDGEPRVFVAYADFDKGPRVQSFAADGGVMWTHALDADRFGDPQRLRVDTVNGSPALLLGAAQSSPPAGGVVALDLHDTAASRTLWETRLGYGADELLHASVGGQASLWVGGRNARLSTLNQSTGALEALRPTGSFVVDVAHGDLDGDGTDEVCAVDETGNLRCLAADGHTLFARALSVGDAGAATSVHLGDVDGDGKAEVITGAHTFDDVSGRGVVQVFSGLGVERRSIVLAESPVDLAAADLNGDGQVEVIVAEAPLVLSGGPPCTVHSFNADTGLSRFSREIGSCMEASLAVGDADEQREGLEVAYADYGLGGPANIALLGADGAPLWQFASAEDSFYEVAIHQGQIISAGAATDEKGRIAARQATDGSISFSSDFEPRTSPWLISARVVTLDAVPDLDGDGRDEWLVGLNTAEAALLSGTSGATVWKRMLEPEELEDADRHTVGAVRYVPAHGETQATLAVALGARDRKRARVMTLALEGDELSSLPTQGEARAASLGVGAGGRPVLFLGAGLDVYGLGFGPKR